MTAGADNQPPDLPSWTQLLGINFRKLRLGALILALVVVASWYGYRQFNRWEQANLVVQANEFIAKGDFRSASLSAQRALQLNFNHIAATRVLATLADRFGSPAAIFWYARLTQLEPGNLQDALAWASAAMRAGELVSADQALSSVSRRGRDTSAFHQAAAALALALQRYPLAELHFTAAARLDPTNVVIRLNLATVRLQSTNAAVLTAARGELEQLRAQPQFKTLALRALAVDAERLHDISRALLLARELQGSPQAEFRDRLAYLDLLHRAHDPGFDAYLRQMEADAGSQPSRIYQVATWMNVHGFPARTTAWVNSLKPALASQLPIPLAAAEAAAVAADWARLQALVADGNWGPLDCMRLAFYARLAREQNQDRQFDSRWTQALNVAQDSPQLLSLLGRLVGGWGWRSEAETVWWSIANGNSGQAGALEALYRLYQANKDTANLYRVSDRIYRLNPADLVAKNNVAQLSLLLNRDVEVGQRLASENYQQNTNAPAFVSTYAFSLYRQGRTAEALKLFRQIQPPLLRQASLAAYYGVLLAADGDRQEASRYLKLADGAPQLLPEEQALVTAAMSRTNSP